MQLQDKVAIITGAGRGSGSAIALAYAQEGAHIVAVARTLKEIQQTAQEVQGLGRRALAVRADVSRNSEVEAMVSAALGEFGRIDILVNSAGVYGPIGPLSALDPEKWLQTIAINLGGTFLCCRAVLPAMMRQRCGKIINLSGGGAASPRPNFSAYAASKAAIVRLTETLAQEVRPHNIWVNAIAPGGVNTRLIDAVLAAGEAAGKEALEEAERLKAGQGTPLEEVAALAVFLASDASDGLTGRLVSVVWDDWRNMASQVDRIMASDLYTLRRTVPQIKGHS
ncbi:MAG: SDR family oxidoreductase [Chloroflexota bacterium]|nr:SDR family oxidoreductase [Chloroflexota bacterium]